MSTEAADLNNTPQTLTPYLTSRRAVELIDFVKAAFGATELFRGIGGAGGLHAEVLIGNSKLMIGGGPSMQPADEDRTALHYYVEDADAVYERALQAGAVSTHLPIEQPYGDREAGIKDLAGNPWYIATHKPGQVTAGRSGGYIREGLRSVTPFLHARGAAGLIEFLQKTFGAEECDRTASPDGVIHYARVRLGNSALEVSEAHGEHQPLQSMLYVLVADVDETYRRALSAGATSIEQPGDQSYGARRAGMKDAFGNLWYIASPPRSAGNA